MSNKKILVLHKDKSDNIFDFPFFSYQKEDIDFNDLIEKHSFSFIDRNLAEKDPTKKQIIPYIIIKDSKGRFFTYKRKGNEKRLHGFFSIGAGGHIDLEDIKIKKDEEFFKLENIDYSNLEKEIFKLSINNFYEVIKITLMREIYEETGIKIDKNGFEKRLKFLGIINEEISDVGKVHIGFVYLYKLLDNEKVSPVEDEIDFFEFYEIGKLYDLWDKLERWSILALSLLNIDKTLIYISDKNLIIEKKVKFFENFGFTEFIEYIVEDIHERNDEENLKIFLSFISSTQKKKKLYYYLENESHFTNYIALLNENGLTQVKDKI
jgi:predicted NUDIX family phosphoesterase